MTTRAEFVAEVRSWIGTPFKWQAALKGEGADCLGLFRGGARNLGLPEADAPWMQVANYGSKIPTHLLRQGLNETLLRMGRLTFGDVVLMKFGGRAQHLGILGDGEVIHTYSTGPKQVIATPLATIQRAWPIVGSWAFASLEDAGI